VSTVIAVAVGFLATGLFMLFLVAAFSASIASLFALVVLLAFAYGFRKGFNRAARRWLSERDRGRSR
jgi:sugar phosphate permease